MKTLVEFDPIPIEKLSTRQIVFMEQALKEVTKKIVADAKSNLQEGGYIRTGSLFNAIKSKIKSNKNGCYGIIGIDNKYVSYDAKGNKIKPAKYAKLVELGTKTLSPSFFLSKAGNQHRKAVLEALTKAATDANK